MICKITKKGFTLIELLAVIVILAVIALIATPIIMGVINDSKKGAAKDSGYAIIKAAELEMSKSDFNAPITYTESNDLNYKGTKPSKMSLEIDGTGKTNMYAFIDGYCVIKAYGDKEVTIDSSKKDATTCLANTKSTIVVDIKDGMIPVSYDSNNNTVKADTSSTWYDYDNKKWANAVVVTSASRDKYMKATKGTAIVEADILAYYVYVPRYRYQLWNANNEAKPEQEIKVEFERRSTAKSVGTKNTEWLTHPAFTFGNDELNGIWVGKFEMTGTGTNPTIKPNNKSLTNQDVLNAFKTIKSMGSDTFGLTSYDSHMMKNMEWGAVVYLTNSKYGRCTNGTCTEVWINNINTEPSTTAKWGPSITGCAALTVSADVLNDMTTCESGRDYKQAGVNASTTGNITGIYDMSGGSWEVMMGVTQDSDGNPLYSSSGFNASTMPETKYYDVFNLTTGEHDFTKCKLGDATRETIKILNSGSGQWYRDFSYSPGTYSSWAHRSGGAASALFGGIYFISSGPGQPWSDISSRAVVSLVD